MLRFRPLLKYATPQVNRSYLIELIVLEVEHMVIGGTYISPQTPATALSTLLDQMTPYRRCLLVGDFNARHVNWCRISKPRGRIIANRAAKDGWTIVTPSKPTFVQLGSRQGTSTIDLALVRGVHVRPVEMLEETQGHRPLGLTVIEGCRGLPQTSTLNDKRRRAVATQWYETEGPKLAALVSSPTVDLDEAYEAYERFTKTPFLRKDRYPTPTTGPLDQEIMETAECKKRALRRGDAAAAASYRRKLRSLVRKRRRNAGVHTVREETLCSSTVAKNIRTRTMVYEEKAAKGEHLAPETYSRFLQGRSGSTRVELATQVNDPLPSDFQGSLVASIKAAHRNKAVGGDAIRTEFLKLAPKTHAMIILKLLRRSLTLGRLPKRWTEVIVRPLLKRGKPASEPSSYRPVSLLSQVRKVVEASLLRYLLATYTPHAAQFAYIPGRRILSALKQVNAGIIQGQHTVCLDLTAAFDLVDKHRVAAQLQQMGLRQSLTMAILLTLSSPSNVVKIGNTVSMPFYTTRGVPQGGCLSPVLFLFVMDNLATAIAQCGATPTLYSDDVAIQGDPRQVQQALLATQEWEETEGMRLSVAKTWALSSGTFLYRNTAIQNLTEGRYLGLILDPGGISSCKSIEGRLPLVGSIARTLRYAGGVDRRSHPIHLRNMLLTFVCGGVRYGEQILDREAIVRLRTAISRTVLEAYGMTRVTWDTLKALLRFREIGQTEAERLFEATQTESTLRGLSRTAPDTATSTLLKALPTDSAWFLLRWWTGYYPDHRVYTPLRWKHPHRLLCWETLAKEKGWNQLEKRHMIRETAWLRDAIYGRA
ncbi:MAG: hypothetical protein KVP17_002755 [Porospora cf. gigantea B]|nr:MAG: hypothetical protein KVP17_002755 [Porospora cf. gigantea B]